MRWSSPPLGYIGTMYELYQHALYIRGSQHGRQCSVRRHVRWSAGVWLSSAGAMVPVLLRRHDRPGEAEDPPLPVTPAVLAMHTHDADVLIVHDPRCVRQLLHAFVSRCNVYRSCTHTRVSSDFPQLKQTKYLMSLPALPEAWIAAKLPGGLKGREKYILGQPGMFGRLWFGQALAFDEAYQIIQEQSRMVVRPSHDSIVFGCA